MKVCEYTVCWGGGADLDTGCSEGNAKRVPECCVETVRNRYVVL
jgi:hypothetical protein